MSTSESEPGQSTESAASPESNAVREPNAPASEAPAESAGASEAGASEAGATGEDTVQAAA
ncbi:MAG TPA: hypothetical protein VLC09_20195, partial [Polyangiaceae bacterium]|nr:hypothetical protein [Polyangiaceae bacterium]